MQPDRGRIKSQNPQQQRQNTGGEFIHRLMSSAPLAIVSVRIFIHRITRKHPCTDATFAISGTHGNASKEYLGKLP